jgi:hypothetical protein
MSMRANFPRRLLTVGLAVLAGATAYPLAANRQTAAATKPAAAAPASPVVSPKDVTDKYCIGCHNKRLHVAELVLEDRDTSKIGDEAELWERVVQKLSAGAMPPAGNRRPDQETMKGMIGTLQAELDKAAMAHPNPGRPPIHRLNRTEYANVIRDILGLDVDAKTMLPADDTGYGFDNIADVLTISPGLLERYMIAASKISRMAVGDSSMHANVAIYSIPYLALGQSERMNDDLPFGSRGGISIKHYFPLDGTYKIRFTLQKNDLAAGDGARGLGVANEIDVRLDRQRVKLFAVGGKRSGGLGYERSSINGYEEEKGLETTFFATAGSHVIGITFNKDRWEMEGVGVGQLPLTNQGYSQPRDTTPSYGRVEAGLEQVQITGPFEGKVPVEGSVRKRLFVCTPTTAKDEEPCARQIMQRIARLAYRRPATEPEINTLIDFYKKGRSDGGDFDAGIQSAMARMLVDVNFLFRPERDPAGVKPGSAYRLTDLELASRLSFFLWSSCPDEELLTVATQGRLRAPGVLEQQVKRMLADKKSDAMVDNFFGQWLTTKNLQTQKPDAKVYPEFDENLRDAFETETSLFLQSQVREDHHVPELLTANYTFVNERLARHYGIPNVRGEQFRRVALPDNTRAGLLGQGSVLTVTSYNDRTSVVMRGKWIMDTILGTPPPPPPNPLPPPLSATKITGSLRQRMELHRKNPVCSACHNIIDPLGFALENFDGVGHYREIDGGAKIDPSGSLADGSKYSNPAEYRVALLGRQDAFLTTLTRRLMTYAMGRGVETYDMAAVRKVLRDSATTDYRWSSLVLNIVKSMPFQMRRAES